jgi:hypothetical protein
MTPNLQMPVWDQQQLLASLRNFIPLTDPRAKVLLTASADQRAKQQVYTLGLQDIIEGKGMRVAEPAGWRYVAAANGIGVAANMTQDRVKITSLGAGPHVYQAMKALTTLRRQPELQDKAFELVTLTVPGARLAAYWLRIVEAPGEIDWLYPYLTFIPELPPLTLKKPEEFLAAIRTVAQVDVKAFDGYQPQVDPRPPKPVGQQR